MQYFKLRMSASRICEVTTGPSFKSILFARSKKQYDFFYHSDVKYSAFIHIGSLECRFLFYKRWAKAGHFYSSDSEYLRKHEFCLILETGDNRLEKMQCVVRKRL